MALERTFQSAFGNGARFFARWGLATFAFWFVLLAFETWVLVGVLRAGTVSPETKRLQDLVVWPIAAGGAIAFIASAFEFLRRVFRVREFLIERGGLSFPSWPVTVIAFGFPIANWFVPWNRLDVIRQTLRSYCETKKFRLVSDPEKTLRALGIVWGLMSIVSIRGDFDDAGWMTAVLLVNVLFFVLSIWTFSTSVRWLSQLQTDFENIEEPRPARLLASPGVTKTGAVQNMAPIRAISSGLANLLNFGGRTRLAPFWFYAAFVIFLSFAGMSAVMLPEMSASFERMQHFAMEHPDQATVEQGPGSYSISIHGDHPEFMPDFGRMLTTISVGFVVIVLLFAAAIVRRLHDRGKTGAWGLMPIPFIVFALWAMPALFAQSTNRTPDLGLFFALFLNNILYLSSLAFLVVLLCGASAKGENRYGPAPAL